jgi:hypothetical protein
MRTQVFVATVDYAPEERLAFVEAASHIHVLTALPRE